MRVCAGIVLYNPEIERLRQCIESIVHQVDSVIIVDNSSDNIDQIDDLTNTISQDKRTGFFSLLKNENNYGIATALNQLCSCASKGDYEWILTLDQDTICSVDMVEKMLPYCNNPKHAIVCPKVVYENDVHCQMHKDNHRCIQDRNDTEYVYACMTSGSLTRLSAWDKVGGFREDYFIDFVDNEFCMKLALSNYKVIRVNTCSMYHQLGEHKRVELMGNRFAVSGSAHSSLRLYYMARNNYAFIKEYKNNLKMGKELGKMIYVLAKGIFLADRKKEAMKNVLRGLRDGEKNRMGNMPN